MRPWFTALLIGLLSTPAVANQSFGAPPQDIAYFLDTLVASYPDHLADHDGIHLLWYDATLMPVSDGKNNKTFKQLLNKPDIDDMFAFFYAANTEPTAPAVNHDPGRIRFEPFFLKMYGDCRKRTLPLRKIRWLPAHNGGSLSVTTVNGVDQALQAVSAELDRLPSKLIQYLKPSAGSYVCRTIAGTQRLSVHAFGAAIDINIKSAHYWRWSKPDQHGVYQWRNKIPKRIIDIFEKHGFIWGGRWYHFDTMHFEYRPELTRTRDRSQ